MNISTPMPPRTSTKKTQRFPFFGFLRNSPTILGPPNDPFLWTWVDHRFNFQASPGASWENPLICSASSRYFSGVYLYVYIYIEQIYQTNIYIYIFTYIHIHMWWLKSHWPKLVDGRFHQVWLCVFICHEQTIKLSNIFRRCSQVPKKYQHKQPTFSIQKCCWNFHSLYHVLRNCLKLSNISRHLNQHS